MRIRPLLLLALAPQIADADITAAQATAILDGCAAHARSRDERYAIAVVDAGGHPVASLRMDGRAHGYGEYAQRKASSVAAWRLSTERQQSVAVGNPGFDAAPQVVVLGGGLPVYGSDGTFLGAVGVSGNSPQNDSACAAAGIKAAGLTSRP